MFTKTKDEKTINYILNKFNDYQKRENHEKIGKTEFSRNSERNFTQHHLVK